MVKKNVQKMFLKVKYDSGDMWSQARATGEVSRVLLSRQLRPARWRRSVWD